MEQTTEPEQEVPKQHVSIPKSRGGVGLTDNETADKPRQTRGIQRDYRMLHDPQSRPRTPKVTQNVGRPTESSAAKTRTKQQEAKTHIAYAYNAAADTEIGIADSDPKNLNEAMAALDWKEWEKAIKVELKQLEDTGTWELVHLPKDRKPIGCRFTFV